MGAESRFGFNLSDAARLLRRDFDRRARDLGLSRSRWQLLWKLSKNEGIKQAALAELLDVAPISLTRQLDRLQEEGLVERRADASDRRCYHLYLLPKARPLLQQMEALALETRAVALSGFSEAEVQQLVDALLRVRNNLSESS